MKIDKEKFLLGVLLGMALIFIIVIFDFLAHKNKKANINKIHIARTVVVDRLPTPTTPTLSDSNSQKKFPTPEDRKTQENFSGYCLNVPVLLYHRVQQESEARRLGQTSLTVDNGILDQQMAYLASHGYTAISAKQLADSLRLHTLLPPKSIVITFDDGYKNHYDYVYPILQKYHILANFMIATGLIGGSDYMSWGQVEEISHSGLIYFVDHTWSHYAVNHGGRDKIKFEIETGKQQLEQHTRQAVNIFAYPYGSFNNEAIKILQEDSFLGAFSTIPGSWQCDSFILSLHRIHIGNAPLSAYGL